MLPNDLGNGLTIYGISGTGASLACGCQVDEDASAVAVLCPGRAAGACGELCRQSKHSCHDTRRRSRLW